MRALSCREYRVGQKLGLRRVEDPEEQIGLFASEENFLIFRICRIQSMQIGCRIVWALVIESAMHVVESGTICRKGNPRAEALGKAIREYGVPFDVKDL